MSKSIKNVMNIYMYHYVYRNIHNAIYYNDIDAVKYMCKNGFKYDSTDMDYAASLYYLEIMKILHINGVQYTNDTMNAALYSDNKDSFNNDYKSYNGKLDVIKHLYNIIKQCDDDSMDIIANKYINDASIITIYGNKKNK